MTHLDQSDGGLTLPFPCKEVRGHFWTLGATGMIYVTFIGDRYKPILNPELEQVEGEVCLDELLRIVRVK